MDEQWTNSRELKTPDTHASGGFFKKLYNGEYSLARTYWLYNVLVNVLVGILDNVLTVTGDLILSLILLVFTVVYNFICLVGVWRAASKYTGFALWAILAKIVVVLNFILIALVIVGLLS